MRNSGSVSVLERFWEIRMRFTCQELHSSTNDSNGFTDAGSRKKTGTFEFSFQK